jgi:hypothetical protein
MSATTTGGNRHLDVGSGYVQELMRDALMIVAEVNNPTLAAPAAPQTFAILRRVLASAGTPSRGIEATYTLATGLTAVVGTVVLPAAWNDRQAVEGGPLLKHTERIIYLMDVPGGDVLQTDRIRYSDPVYGNQVFDVTQVQHNSATNIVRCLVAYAREEGT